MVSLTIVVVGHGLRLASRPAMAMAVSFIWFVLERMRVTLLALSLIVLAKTAWIVLIDGFFRA